MKIEGDYLAFSAGRKVYANRGIIGLCPELEISEGYDGGLDTDDWTASEFAELADYMIEQWLAFKAARS